MQKQDLYFRYSEKSESLRSVNMPSEIAAGDEESVHTANLDAASSTTVRAQSATSTAPSAPESKIVYPSTFRVLLIVLSLSLSTLLVALDRTIVPTAIWYVSAYLLTATALQPTWGKVYQIFTVKSVFILAMTLFLSGSFVCATAPNSKIFIIGRAISGVGSGGIFSGCLTIIAYVIPLHRRPTFTGVLTSLFGIASFLGPIIGGIFTEKITWRWCFFINLPLGVVAMVGIVVFLKSAAHPATKETTKKRLGELDYIGLIFFIPANVSLLLALQWGGSQYSWKNPVILSLLIGFGILISIWIYSQFRLGEKATIPVRLMTQRTVFFSSILAFLASAAYMIPLIYLPLYFQAVKGVSAIISGFSMTPIILCVTVSSIVAGVLLTKVGYYTPFMIVGMAFLAVGLGLLSTLGIGTSIGQWIGYQIIAGVGAGLNLQMPILAVHAVVPLNDIAVANALFLLFQQLGPAIFVAIAQTVLLNKFLPQLQTLYPDLSGKEIIEAGATGLKSLVTESELPTLLVAYAKSVDAVFLIAAVLAAVAALLALCVEWKSIKKDKPTVVEDS